MASGIIEEVHLLYSPIERASINNYDVTRSAVLVSIYENVTGSARALNWDGSAWVSIPLDFPTAGSVSIGATHDKEDIAFVSTQSFLIPSTLWKYEADTGSHQAIKSLPAWFDSSAMIAEQFETPSSDGALIPYFVVRKRDLPMNSSNPTLLYGYGGFLKSISPYHNLQDDTKYPEVFFITSTKDDRVHPAHARKMAARFEDLGHEFLYYENVDGGHSAAANLKETARRVALQHTYLMEKLS